MASHSGCSGPAPGITRMLSSHSTHQVPTETGMFLYRVRSGRARFLGLHTEA